MGKFIDLTGQRFGRLVALERVENSKSRQACWRCICDCGNHTVVCSFDLRSGNTASCGCWQKEIRKTLGQRVKTHGLTRTRLYRIWNGMVARCVNPNERIYDYYGGRGITVCDEWRKFESFRDWALSHGYTDSLSIDRIDVNGNYEPNNCRWATAKEQHNNQRSNRLLTAFGKTQTLQQWADELNVNRRTICYRLNRGWSLEDALTTPVKSRSTRKK